MSTPPRRPRQPAALTRTSNHVGRPWMLDGKILRGATGMPMRRMALANSRFADAEPEPLTLANLTTKSLTAWIGPAEGFIPPPSPQVCARRPRSRTADDSDGRLVRYR